MATQFKWFCVTVYIFMSILSFQAWSYTNDLEVQTLGEMYKALNIPPQLKNWSVEGGDPCEESWIGVGCSGSSVIQIKLQSLNLTGTLGFQLSNLQNLRHLDLSFNNIQGEIPYDLPHNLTHLNLACNNFRNSIPFPYSLTSMNHLTQLNLSNNLLSGPLGDFFGGLVNLKQMDLSYNNLTGDLPSSFEAMKSLKSLFLQSNSFTGSVIHLAGLSLNDLNIEDNHFSGVIPENFQQIKNLWFWGNSFHTGENDLPWNFPLEGVPNQNISSPPTMQSSAIEKNNPSHTEEGHKRKRAHTWTIVAVVIGAALVAIFATLFIVVWAHRSRKPMYIGSECTENSIHSLPTSTAKDFSSTVKEDSQYSSQMSSPLLISPWQLPPIPTRTMRMSKRSSANKFKGPICAKVYTITELQSATNNFSQQNLLGEGSLGSVYRAEFPDGQIFAVKTINMVALSLQEEEIFLDVIRTASRLRHSNIVALSGYCVEYGQYFLVYEYIRSHSLQDALHSTGLKSLSWKLRLRIALGTARALNYLHSSCVPPIAHSNLKAANVLLDEDRTPRVSDCGLANLRTLTTNSVKLKASEMAISESGYVPPEHIQGGIGNTKADVYTFGVLLLELLTGRRPLDSSRPRDEQHLVEWASSRLRDENDSLAELVDPSISRKVSSLTLSRIAHTISLCLQPEKERRPEMCEIVEWLMALVSKKSVPVSEEEAAASTAEADPFERSFRTTKTHLLGSPRLA
ncbi:hypothetical protein DM860_005932 [Cuscuta australis]|uniref:Protein kinase domain-containing protein n=1 Tax=Cuscuta australis TaxID=267555 RepID=A0A328DVA2_9ASTE|nr:hypothetical protein DM860_005932 [Cuscuta australis]